MQHRELYALIHVLFSDINIELRLQIIWIKFECRLCACVCYVNRTINQEKFFDHDCLNKNFRKLSKAWNVQT